MFIHRHFNDVSLEGLENGFPIFGGTVPERLHGDARAFVRVQNVYEGFPSVLDDILACLRFAENAGEAKELESRFLDDLMSEGLLLNVTEYFCLWKEGEVEGKKVEEETQFEQADERDVKRMRKI